MFSCGLDDDENEFMVEGSGVVCGHYGGLTSYSVMQPST